MLSGGGGGEYGGINGDRRRRDWGGEHTLQCTDDVLCDCAPEICIIVLTRVTPINAIKREKSATCRLVTL